MGKDNDLFPHLSFPYRLEYDDKGIKKVCWFECEDHLVKHITRYHIEKGKVDVLKGFTLTTDPLKPKPKRKKRPSGGKGSQASKTKKPISRAAKDPKPTRAAKTKGKKLFSNLDEFFDDK